MCLLFAAGLADVRGRTLASTTSPAVGTLRVGPAGRPDQICTYVQLYGTCVLYDVSIHAPLHHSVKCRESLMYLGTRLQSESGHLKGPPGSRKWAQRVLDGCARQLLAMVLLHAARLPGWLPACLPACLPTSLLHNLSHGWLFGCMACSLIG